MGQADNKSYKDMYHFTDSFWKIDKDSLPSVNGPAEINTTIKKNPYRSNVNIEKDEIVLQPDLSSLHKARGKKHYDGGMDVNLKPDTFIYSDDKDLAFNEGDHKLFELKEGGTFNKRKNTPADVLKRNVDLKHYNTLVANLDDKNASDLTKKSSALMLQKYIATLGNIAYLQEQKKDFPDGVPPFAANSAPVYNPETKDNIMEQKQYAKYGGKINPYANPEAGWGMRVPIDPYKKSRTPQGSRTPTNQNNHYDRGPEYLQQWEGVIPNISKMSNADAQSAIYDHVLETNPDAIAEMWKKYGLTSKGMKNKDMLKMTHNGVFGNDLELNKDTLKYFKDAYVDGLFGARQLDLQSTPQMQRIHTAGVPVQGVPTAPDLSTIVPKRPDTLTVPDVTGGPQAPIRENWQFTPWQKLSQTYNLAKYAAAKRYMPMRSHMNPSYMDAQLVNPEQVIGDMRGASNAQMSALNTLNPAMRNAQAASTYGQLLNQMAGVRSQYDNQNVGITNQTRAANNQIRNNATAQNMQNDQQYYQQSVAGQQNFDNMKSFLSDQYMNGLQGDVQSNQTLAYNLLTQNNPAYGYDFKTGNMYRNPKSILDVQSNGANDELKGVMDIINQITDPSKKAAALTKLYGLKVFGSSINEPRKKGGRVNPYKK